MTQQWPVKKQGHSECKEKPCSEIVVGDWSLITGRGPTKWMGGSEVLPLRKGAAEKVLAMLKGGGGSKNVMR